MKQTSANAICFASDSNFFLYALFAAQRVATLAPNGDFDIYVLTTADSRPDPTTYSAKVQITRIDDRHFEGLPVSEKFPKAAYVRLIAPEILRDYQKILYLDADTYLKKPTLEPLFSEKTNGYPMLGALDFGTIYGRDDKLSAYIYRELDGLGLDESKYINSGVLLINTSDYAATGGSAAIVKFISQTPKLSQFLLFDQNAINLFFGDEIGLLAPCWNWQHASILQDTHMASEAAIYHFVGPQKPWQQVDDAMLSPFLAEYQKILTTWDPAWTPSRLPLTGRLSYRKYQNPLREHISRKQYLRRDAKRRAERAAALMPALQQRNKTAIV